MKKFISDFMDEVFTEFTSSIDGKCLCELKNNRYDNRSCPDYNVLNEQLFYLLRYFPAYLCEYKYLYSKIIRTKDLDSYNVLSIGCGSAIDYYGLYLATGKEIDSICYKGIDLVDWKYRKSLGNGSFSCINQNVSELDFSQNTTFNILFFPKSLSEIAESDFKIFLRSIEQGVFSSNIVYFVSSTMDSGFIHDQRKYELVRDAFIKNGFRCENYKTTQEIKDKRAFVYLDPEFEYPDPIKKYMLELNEKCPTYSSTGKNCDNTCKSQLARFPILKTTHMSYQINKLER